MQNLADRRSFLAHVSTRRSSEGKRGFVVAECVGRAVLDIGCIDHDAANAFDPRLPWLHGEIAKVASAALGLDALEDDVERVVAAGFDVVVGDAERFDLGRTFDVVVAADIIEHLDDLGSFLTSARAHMAPTSTLVLTTPNAVALNRFVQALVRNAVQVNDEHTMWLDPSVAHELLTRNGLEPVRFAWLHDDARTGSLASKALDLVASPLLRYRPLLRRSFGIVARRSA